MPREPSVERRQHARSHHAIAVALADRVEPRVKARPRIRDLEYADIGRQPEIQRALNRLDWKLDGEIDARDLADRVDPSIGPAGARNSRRLSHERRASVFQKLLDR